MSGGHRRVARWASLCAVLAVALASWASADAGPRAPSLEADTWPAAPALGEPTPSLPPFRDPDARRPVPDYDGLPPRDPDPLDLALAFPRALMRPVHLLLEHGMRRPLRELVTAVEKTRFWE